MVVSVLVANMAMLMQAAGPGVNVAQQKSYDDLCESIVKHAQRAAKAHNVSASCLLATHLLWSGHARGAARVERVSGTVLMHGLQCAD